MHLWQVQHAKARFSEVLERARGGEPQFVTRHGKEEAVVLSATEYRSLARERKPERSFVEHLLAFPKLDDAVDADELFKRDKSLTREVEFE